MSTDLPTLTTEELCSQCEEVTGFRPSVHQLGDWVSLGFLPASKPGSGRGRRIGGSEPRRWDAECLPRLIVIARSRKGNKGKYVSVKQAALALAIKGYSPGKKHLRTALEEYIAEWNEDLSWHRGLRSPGNGEGENAERMRRERQFARLSPDTRSDLFKKAAERRNADIRQPLRKHIITTSAVIREAPAPYATDAMSKFGQYFSLSGLQTALRAASDDQLLAAYERATVLLQGQQVELAHFLLLLATAFSTAISGTAPKSNVRDAVRGIVSSFLPVDMQKSTLSMDPGVDLEGALRLYMTLVILIADQQGQPLVELGDKAVLPILQILSSFAAEERRSPTGIDE